MPNGENQKTRYHAEVKLNIEGHEARVNCFADTLVEIFNDIGTIVSQFPPDWKNPAKREIANAELKAKQLTEKAAAAAAPELLFGEGKTGEIPVCESCGSDEFMELIEFADKKTGRPRKAWKCQQCQKWHWPNGKGRRAPSPEKGGVDEQISHYESYHKGMVGGRGRFSTGSLPEGRVDDRRFLGKSSNTSPGMG